MQIELDIMQQRLIVELVKGERALLQIVFEETLSGRHIIAAQIADCNSILRQLGEQVE